MPLLRAQLKLSLAATLLALAASVALAQASAGAAGHQAPHSPVGAVLITLGVVLLGVVWWVRARLIAQAAVPGRGPEAPAPEEEA